MSDLGILLIVGVVLAALILIIYNGIIARMNSVERAWANVITEERQKNKIIPTLEGLVDQYKLHESSVLKDITALRSALQELSSDNVDTAQLAAAEAKSGALMKGLNVVVENYPDLKASEVFNNLMREVAEQQDNIGAAIRIFNQNVESFNNGIEQFPNSLVNNLLNKKVKLNTFSDEEAEGNFEYKPNIS
ncbi:MAG: LemA family protein [Parvibaculaceae bacterium]|nr:LemA family protein [Parvibaculaceae bacterium]